MILYDKEYFALFFRTYISVTCIHIYSYILVCENCCFWDKYWVWDILHDKAFVWCLSTSMCQVGFSNNVVDNFLSMSAGTSKTSGLTHVIHLDDSVTEMLHVTVFSYWSDMFLDIY